MKLSLRIYFLIGVAADVLHLSASHTAFVLAGYAVLESFDEWLARRARNKAMIKEISDETEGWVLDENNPTYESKGDFSRIRLPDGDQIIVTRITDLLVRLARQV